MTEATTIGIDLAKSVFQVHGADATGAAVVKRQLKRREVIAYFTKLPPCLIGMEACGTAHYWARELTKLGHAVKLMPPSYVKAYLKRGKTDAADAAAICEAVSRQSIRVVPIKTVEQQSLLILHRTRDMLVSSRTRMSNALRGHMSEFGLAAPVGGEGLATLIAIVENTEDVRLTPIARLGLGTLVAELGSLGRQIATLDRAMLAAHKGNETSRRLESIPGVGPVLATAVTATVGEPGVFKSGRAFAAWLGLTPRITGTGGKTSLGPITKQGDRYLRRLLVGGATAVLRQARIRPDKHPLAASLLGRMAFKQAAVALANKNARTIWALMARGGTYTADHRSVALGAA
jgi:transposase